MTPTTRSMMDVAPTICDILGVSHPNQTQGSPIEDVVKYFDRQNHAAILALDALGLFAWDLWRTKMPYLNDLHGQNSIILQSVMPTITPVNFTTMVTGTDQERHGVNTFKDDIGCESVFDVLRSVGRKSAGIGLDGFTGRNLLGRHADIDGNAGTGSDEGVAEKIMEIANQDQPDFIIAQFGRVDDFFHLHGPSSPEMVPVLQQTDDLLQTVIPVLKNLGYAVIVLADHGQHDVIEPRSDGLKGWHGSDRREDLFVPCTWI